MYTPNNSNKPYVEADIRLLKAPIKANPPKVFDARALIETLNPYVKGDKKCGGGNVCPHIKKYLFPLPEPTPKPSSQTISDPDAAA